MNYARLISSLLPLLFLPQIGNSVEVRELSESRQYITESDMDSYNNWTFNVMGVYGLRSLKGSDFAPVNKQSNTGIMFDAGRKEWPLHFCIDYFSSDDSGTDAGIAYDSSVEEIDLGVRYIIDIEDQPITLIAGFGYALVDVEVKADSGVLQTNDSMSTDGFWLEIGSYYRFQDRFLVGFDLRYTDARARLNTAGGLNAGGWQTNFTLGMRF